MVKIKSQYFCYISYQQEERRPLDKGFYAPLESVRASERELLWGRGDGLHYTLHNRLILPFGDSSSTAAWRERSSQLMNMGLLLFSYCLATASFRRLRERIWLSLCLPRLKLSGVKIFFNSVFRASTKHFNCIEKCHWINWVMRTFQR